MLLLIDFCRLCVLVIIVMVVMMCSVYVVLRKLLSVFCLLVNVCSSSVCGSCYYIVVVCSFWLGRFIGL